VVAPADEHARVVEVLQGLGFHEFPYGAVGSAPVSY
jgi:hypothetical protein